jgi:type I restriction enzyme M protein
MSPKGGIKPHSKFAIQSNRSEVLFVDYIATHLKPNGRAGIVVPEGIMFQGGKSYVELRKRLIEEGLYAVVSLPSGVFQPYSGVKTSILFIDKSMVSKSDSLLFCEVSADGTDLGVKRKTVKENDLPSVLKAIHDFSSGTWAEGMAGFKIQKADLLSNSEVSLSQQRYKPEQEFSSEHRMVRIGDLLAKAKSQKVGNASDVKILSITMAHGLVDQDEKFKKRIASDDISNYKLVSRNQLVVGFPIDEGVLSFQTRYDLAAVSPAYDVWDLVTPDQVNINFLETLLRSIPMREIYRERMQGSVSRRRSLPQDVFESLTIPLPSLEIQDQIVSELDGYLAVIEGAKKISDNWKPTLVNDGTWPVFELGQISEMQYGLNESAEDSGTHRFIRITDIDELGNLRQQDKKYVSVPNDQSDYVLAKGDVLIARTGATYGKCLFFEDIEPAVFAGYLIRIKPAPELLPRFLWIFTQSKDFDEQKRKLVTGGGQPQFNANTLKMVKVPVPPLEIQEAYIAQIEKQLELTQSILNLAETQEQLIADRISQLWSY